MFLAINIFTAEHFYHMCTVVFITNISAVDIKDLASLSLAIYWPLRESMLKAFMLLDVL